MRGHEENSTFVQRFDVVRKAVIRMQVVRGLCWGICTAGAAIAALAAADYFLEWPWHTRATWLVAGMGFAAFVSAMGILRPVLHWSRPKTARELEALFPQLGQRVRTVVQFSGRDPQRISGEGVRPDLVSALEDETRSQAEPLDLNELVPRRPAVVAAVTAAIPFVLLAAGFLLDWQWRLAVSRALLGNTPYTTIAVKPGDVIVDQGHDLTLSLTLQGRVDRQVALVTQKSDAPEAGTTTEALDSASIASRSDDGRSLEYCVAMSEVNDPFDYRFLAGKLESPAHHVTIRYPLSLTKFEATLTPPEYTGLPAKTTEGGDLLVIEDSRIEFTLQFDRSCREAYLLISDPPYTKTERGTPERIDLQPGEGGLQAAVQLREDKVYSIVASAREGSPLPENEYRIRIRKDQAPHVRFDDPPEAWEVNPLAEVPMRIRVDDDFGVSKAGIVFQIDNGEERRLATAEYSTSVKPDAEGKIALTTRAALEELLILEDFPVTETSAVTYYGYVEDNYPEKPKQATTDLRFIEIRPFMRFFRLGGTCQGNGQCMTLEELIARQRHLLNRTTRIARAGKAAVPDDRALGEMIRSETNLADFAIGFAEALEAMVDYRCEFLYEAEKAMRESIVRLRAREFAPSAERQAEALASLIKARGAIRNVFGESMSAAAAQKFDREQMQKLRKPPTEEEQAEQIAAQLGELAERERIVYETLGGAPCEARSPSETPSSNSQASSAASQASQQAEPQESEGGQKPEQKEQTSSDGKELERRQYEIVLDAYQIQKQLEGLEDITELARRRMGGSIEQAERASDAMLRGDNESARDAAGEASRSLKELARHVAGLTARDLAGKIGAARNLSAELAQEHRDLADRLDGNLPPGSPSQQGSPSGSAGEKKEGDQPSSSSALGGRRASQQGQPGQRGQGEGRGETNQAQSGNLEGSEGRGSGDLNGLASLAGEAGLTPERGTPATQPSQGDAYHAHKSQIETLKDLLDALARDGDLDGELAAKLAAALEATDLKTLLREIEAIEESLRNAGGRNPGVEVRAVARQLEVLSGALDALHGAVVSPRLAELIELESRVAQLRERLEKLTSDSEISQWHLDAQQLMETLERTEAAAAAAEDLRQAMEDSGWAAERTNWGWDYVHDNRLGLSHYAAPATYVTNLILLEKAIQREAKELLLRDMVSSLNDAVPPAYEKLVERYFEVLSREKQAER
ncbi:MAG: hypothetical protein GXX96_24075 [Planctomycetaceae bacterium]|nr:hypothetical protein [Planctomycetaceae bacterium]